MQTTLLIFLIEIVYKALIANNDVDKIRMFLYVLRLLLVFQDPLFESVVQIGELVDSLE
jgi:hypothetical protein